MTFQLKTSYRFYDFHGNLGLMDWDMEKELKLAMTSDQLHQEEHVEPPTPPSGGEDELTWYDETSDKYVKPSLWLWVNPNIVCPEPVSLQLPCDPVVIPDLHRSAPLQEELPRPCPLEVKGDGPARRRRRSRTIKDLKNLEPGCWPRPPVSYCTLITLALKSSHSGGLKVQQIYNFTREHFPFFQTAPDGWKNTIRHNLCFNSSFSKTCNLLCRDGKRKSCFWHLTVDGHQRLADEIHTLTQESFRQLERSTAHPDVVWRLLDV